MTVAIAPIARITAYMIHIKPLIKPVVALDPTLHTTDGPTLMKGVGGAQEAFEVSISEMQTLILMTIEATVTNW